MALADSRPEEHARAVPHWTAIDWGLSIRNRLVDDRRVRYVDYGTGPVLVLLHGMAASWQWWLENIPTLAQNHRVIAVDLPGFGHSEPLPAPAEMATHATVVLALLAQLEIGSATVVSHSMGGLVALEMARSDPHRIRGLVLLDAGGVPMTQGRLTLVMAVVRFLTATMRLGFVRRALATSTRIRQVALRAGFRNPSALSPELAAEIIPVFAGPGSADAVAAAGRAVRTAAPPESITCPVLLIWGEHDVLVPLSCAQEMNDRLAQSELVVIGGVGHSPMIESVDEFNTAVLSFTASSRDDQGTG